MAVIHVLDKHTAELIAAGEVVERPASVVKELVENAIDAGATSVAVSIERGGVACIQIADNGSGIDTEYIPTAFIRHATSKIRTQEDLESIHTLGFRGEALASVASVARIELLTKTEADEFACLYRMEGGEELGLEAAARPVGTTITVRDLFYNTPARMKFLKKDTSEANFVSDVVTHAALSHPEVAFKFVREGKTQFQTPGDGKLRAAAYAVLTRDFAQDLVEVNYEEGLYRVTGCVTPPKSGRASRAMQFFFLNGRYIKNTTMMAALEAAYKTVLMQGKYPGCILSLTMPANLVDVNVHPAKTEVRFAREKDIFDIVYKAVKSVLLTPQSTEREFVFAPQPQTAAPVCAMDAFGQVQQPQPQIKTQTQAAAGQPVALAVSEQNAPDAPAVPLSPRAFVSDNAAPDSDAQEGGQAVAQRSFTPVTAKPSVKYSDDVRPMPQPINTYNRMLADLAEEAVVPYRTDETVSVKHTETLSAQMDLLRQEETDAPEELRFVGEVFNTYIVAQRGTDLCFIDKHAAHERILYEALAQNYGSVSSQMLLCPVTVQLSADEKNALLQNETLLTDSGVEVDDFGGNAVVVRAVPADVVPDDVQNLIIELADRMVHNQRDTTSEKTQWVLHSIACRAAVKAGDKSHQAQLLKLAQEVLDGAIPPFCPHGRPVILKVTKKELEKQFGRQS